MILTFLLDKLVAAPYNKSRQKGVWQMAARDMHTDPEQEIQIGLYRHGDIQAHTHNFLELVYVVSGTAMHTVNGRTGEVGPGDYFIIDYKMQHAYKCEKGQQVTLINLLFRPRFIDRTLAHCDSFQQILSHYLIQFQDAVLTQVPTGTVFHDTDGTLRPLLTAMQTEYERQNYGYIELLRCYLIQIIVLILRSLAEGIRTKPRHACTQFMTAYINSHYMEAVSLAQISHELNYSLPYLSKRFRADMGISFQQYLQKIRIYHSCRLLANSQKTVREVAELVGYSDIKFFQTVFKRQMQMPPKAYQRLCRTSASAPPGG